MEKIGLVTPIPRIGITKLTSSIKLFAEFFIDQSTGYPLNITFTFSYGQMWPQNTCIYICQIRMWLYILYIYMENELGDF